MMGRDAPRPRGIGNRRKPMGAPLKPSAARALRGGNHHLSAYVKWRPSIIELPGDMSRHIVNQHRLYVA